ncbi:MAG: twin-arginine translocation signal domain-containing protein, partial [Armatimonadetes bacterium]|nr:twin-arginine translocation signal domain-containing protein [Armatimonadota bacterium]
MTSRRRFLQIVAGAGAALGGCQPSSPNRSAMAPAANGQGAP